MRISDWSSDVCSSDLFAPEIAARIKGAAQEIRAGAGELREAAILNLDLRGFTALAGRLPPPAAMRLLAEYQQRLVPVIQRHGGSIEIGTASWRERGCQYVWISVGAVSLKKKQKN